MPKNRIEKHTLKSPQGLIRCDTVLDVGCGVRPVTWYKPKRRICVEPFGPYCDVLTTAGFTVVQEEAIKFFEEGGDARYADAIYLLDVIEHLEKEDGLKLIDLMLPFARQQVVVFTPYGFMEQTTDKWGYGGHYWQTHRSGWLPEEFPDWRTELYWSGRRTQPYGFFASWEPSTAS